MSGKVNIKRKYKTPKAVLRATLRLFEESKSNWTRGINAHERPKANGGIAFCALGSIQHFAATEPVRRAAAERLYKSMGMAPVSHVNDSHNGYKRIIIGLRKAVA